MIRHLYDCNTVNPGDVAIGQVMADFMTSQGVKFEQGGPDAPEADTFVIGGGHLLQPGSEEYYQGFRRHGQHHLYSVGVSGGVGAVRYLKNYRSVSVRTKNDKKILSKLTSGVKIDVYPCPANLLPIEPSGITVEPGTVGVQVFYPGYPEAYIEQLKGQKILAFPWRRSIRGETVDDLIGAKAIAEKLNGELLPTGLSPGQYRDVIQQLDFFVCQSLHAAMWAYQSNVSFTVHGYSSKISHWARERGLSERIFRRPNQVLEMLEKFKSKTTFSNERDRERATNGLARLCRMLKGG